MTSVIPDLIGNPSVTGELDSRLRGNDKAGFVADIWRETILKLNLMKHGKIKLSNSNGQIIGLGIDIVDIPRFRKTLEKRGKKFIDRIFLPSEKKYCRAKANPWIHFAGRFAAKEAVAKAFGTGIGKEIGWLDMEILSLDSKAPVVRLSRRAAMLARQHRAKNILVSISHTHAHSSAVALLTA